MMAIREAAAAGLARLTPRRVQEVLEESISFAVESGASMRCRRSLSTGCVIQLAVRGYACMKVQTRDFAAC